MHFCISCEFLPNNNNRGDFISPDFSMQLRFVLNGATHSKKNRIQNGLPVDALSLYKDESIFSVVACFIRYAGCKHRMLLFCLQAFY